MRELKPPGHKTGQDWLLGSGRELARAPHTFVAGVGRASGGLGRFRVLNRNFVAITEPEYAQQVLVSHRDRYVRSFHTRNIALIAGTGLIASEGARWRRDRRQMQGAFKSEGLKSLVPAACAAVAERLDTWARLNRCGEAISALEEMQILTMSATGRMLFSDHIGPAEAIRVSTVLRKSLMLIRKRNTSLWAAPAWMPTVDNRRLAGYKRALNDFVEGYIQRRSGAPEARERDMLSALLASRDPETGAAFSPESLVDQAKTLFLAGYETTAIALAWALYLLARHPDAAAGWHEEVDRILHGRLPTWEDLPKLRFVGQILHETLRLYPPIYNTARECTADDTLGRHAIRKGSIVVISIYGVHRAGVWGEAPNAFRPERFGADANWPKRAFMPFASGPHVCLGNHFAMAEMVVALAMIGQRFRVTAGEDRPVEATPQITLVPEREIKLRLASRS